MEKKNIYETNKNTIFLAYAIPGLPMSVHNKGFILFYYINILYIYIYRVTHKKNDYQLLFKYEEKMVKFCFSVYKGYTY